MAFIPEWAPNIHPLLVHFPIAILFFAALMDILTFFLHERWWDEKKTAVIYLIGAIITIAVYFTGGMAADSIHIPKAAYHAVGEHAGWARWTMWFFGIYALIRIIASSLGFLRNNKIHVFFFVLSLIGIFFLYETGEHGAKLVFGYGLGTGNISYAKEQPDSLAPAGYSESENGGWIWKAGPGAEDVFRNRFTSFSPDTQMIAVRGDSIKLQAGSTFFTGKNAFQDFQLDLSVNANQLNGDLLVLHHVRDSSNYDYMALRNDGSAELGRVHDGETKVFEQASSVSWQRGKHIRFVNSGEHKRGYVDDTLVLHGHIEPGAGGGVGLKVEGEGSLFLRQMKVAPVENGEHKHEEGHEHH